MRISLSDSNTLRTLFSLVIGVSTGAGLFAPTLWWTAPLGMALLFFLLTSTRGRTGAAFLVGFAYGFGLIGMSFLWGFETLPLVWLGIPNVRVGFCIISFIWGVFTVILASVVGLWACLALRLLGSLTQLCACAGLFVAFEFLRALLFSIVAWGPGSTLGADLSFGFIGYVLSWSSGFLWLARAGGVATLSFCSVFLGGFLFFIYQSKLPFRTMVTLGAACLFVAFGFFFPSPVVFELNPQTVSINGHTIAPLSLYIDAALSRNKETLTRDEQKSLLGLRGVFAVNPDIIIFPEYARFFQNEHFLSEANIQEVESYLKTNRTLVVDSTFEELQSGGRGSAVFYDGEREGVVLSQQKRLLIPLGEYLPYALSSALRVAGFTEEVAQIEKYRTAAPSHRPFSSRLIEWRGITIGVLNCSETLAPFGYKALASANADVLVNIASHAWVGSHSNLMFMEALAMARIHSVYAWKPFIQATNYAPSYALIPRPL